MKPDATKPALSAIFVDYDNIYLALKRKSEEAAKRFSKDAALWLRELESGRLITGTSGFTATGPRRIVLNRCYGNPMPRRNASDNSTDMNSFPFVRHHYLRAGSEVIDCPPLTAQLKNSADIRIVMDVRDMLTHDTYFDEFIILSGDADFTPLLHRLRAHARRTVIYANDHTASPYTAISDGEVREADLLRLLLEGTLGERVIGADAEPAQLPRSTADQVVLRIEIMTEIIALVRAAGQPVPLEALADRAVRQLGHDKTAGSGWGGTGTFRDLLIGNLPDDLRISEQAPFVVFEVARMIPADARAETQRIERAPAPAIAAPLIAANPTASQPVAHSLPALAAVQAAPPVATLAPAPVQPQIEAPMPSRTVATGPSLQQRAPIEPAAAPVQPQRPTPLAETAPAVVATPSAPTASPQRPAASAQAVAIQQAVARIYEACQAPPLSPPEYRALFDVMAQEITTRGLTGAPTLDNIVAGAKQFGVEIRRDDVRFILEVVSETDPWFEQGASANLFAGRFRNFVVARCRSQGLALSAEELDLIEHWFAGGAAVAAAPAPTQQQRAPVQSQPPQAAPAPAPQQAAQPDRWWSMEQPQGEPLTASGGEDFPRIIRTRMRG
jgi:hypothetical protein